MRKIGISFNAMEGLSSEVYAKTIADLGFEATFTGVPGTPERMSELGNAFAANGVAWETMHAPYKNINQMWLEGEGGEAMHASLLHGVDACHAAGVPILVVHLSLGLKPPSITDLGRARFTALVEHALANGVQIAFENQRKLANIARTFEAFEDAPNVGFCWDTGHENCFSPGRQYMPLFGKKLICTHIHDNNGEFNNDEHLLPFDGKLDFDRAARQIRESGFTGSLMLEAIAANSHRYDGMTCEAYLERAAVAAKRLRDMVDG